MGIIVSGVGDSPCEVMVVGERPGYDEFVEGIPFVGASGQLQDKYFQMHNLHRRRMYLTNLVKDYHETNADPTQEDIDRWTPTLIGEIDRVRPKFIISVGAYATRWFLGDVDMETVHGLPQRSRNPDANIGGVVIPVYHPAFGLRDADALTLVFWDYRNAARIIKGQIDSTPAEDHYPGAQYYEATPGELAEVLRSSNGPIALDTEGSIEHEWRNDFWGFSLTTVPGSGLVFRRNTPYFRECVRVLTEYCEKFDPLIVLHNGIGLDIDIFRRIGLDLRFRRLYDTMVAMFFLRVEPQALKSGARRHCGMYMRDYTDMVGDVAVQKQLEWLISGLEVANAYPKPEARLIQENDGTSRVYTPQHICKRIEAIISDFSCKAGTSLLDRWKKVDEEQRVRLVRDIGPFPTAGLDDIPLADAVWYSGRDPDATLRLYYKCVQMIGEAGLTERLQLDLDILPIFEEMQATGFIADRNHFIKVSADMWDRMMTLGSRISTRYNNGQPFNPLSAPQVSELARSRSLRGVKKTKTGKVSTSKKSMEHLRTIDEAMDDVFTWRGYSKIKDSFSDPIVEQIPAEVDRQRVCCTIKITRVTSDRISAADPNYTAQPQSELGQLLKEGFYAAPPPWVEEAQAEGLMLGSADLSQIEMRVAAHLSHDPFLSQLFHEKRDAHAETAIKIFHLDPTRVWSPDRGEFDYPGVHKKKYRNPTKRAGFGVLTAIQGEGLLDQLRMMGCEGWQVEKFPDGQSDCVAEWCKGGIIHEWFNVYPMVRKFLRSCGDKVENSKDGIIREMGGFPRYLPGVWSNNKYVRLEARRQSHSHIISGSAQWMLRESMRWLKPHIEDLRRESGLRLAWTLQIHDELLFAFDPLLHDVLKDLVLEALTKHSFQLSVPVEANWASGTNWGKLEK